VEYPYVDDPKQLSTALKRALTEWGRHFRFAVQFDSIASFVHYSRSLLKVSECQRELSAWIRSICHGQALIPIDKDTKRRMIMNPLAYQFRLVDTFLNDPKTYTVESLTCTDACQFRSDLFAHIPKTFLRHMHFNISTLPRAYALYKSKCLDGSSWKCERDHNHERIIVSCFQDASRNWNKSLGKALRVLLQKGPWQTQSLWNQSMLATEIRRRFATLKHGKFERRVCQHCACEKKAVAAVKIDATSFYTQPNLVRVLDRAKMLVQDCTKRGWDRAVFPKPHMKGPCFLANEKSFIPTTHKAVTFDLVLMALGTLKDDRFLRVGDKVVKQINGLPMGNACSPILCILELEHGWHSFCTDQKL
jgi:hypothetical protein